MKKILLILVLIAGAYQLKAQQLLPPKPADSLLNPLKLNSNLLPNIPLNQLQIGGNLTAMVNDHNFNSLLQPNNAPIDNMPVAKLEGHSNMPIAKLKGDSKMPIVNLNNPYQSLTSNLLKIPETLAAPVNKK